MKFENNQLYIDTNLIDQEKLPENEDKNTHKLLHIKEGVIIG